MKKLKNFPGLTAHPAQNEKESAQLAVRGDIASILEGVLDHPRTTKQRIDLLHKEHPFQASRNAAGLLRVLMTGYVPDRGTEVPADLKAAKQALIAGHPEQTLAYLAEFLKKEEEAKQSREAERVRVRKQGGVPKEDGKEEKDELELFCKEFVGFLAHWKIVFALASRPERRGQGNFDLMGELIRYLVEHNKTPLSEVRGRITTLLEATEASETEDRETADGIDRLEKKAVLVLSGQKTPRNLLHFRRFFRIPKGQEEAKKFQTERELNIELKEDLWIEVPGSPSYTVTQDDLEAIAEPLTRAGISVQYGAENKAARTPGWIKAKKEDINAALTSPPPKLVLHKISDAEYEIRQSPSHPHGPSHLRLAISR